MTEESTAEIDFNRDRAIKVFAVFGISITPDQLEDIDYSTVGATLDYKESPSSGNEATIMITCNVSALGDEDFLDVTREIRHRSGLFLAGVGCSATISQGVVRDYKLRLGNHKTGYVIELNPDGTVQRAYQEYSADSDDFREVVSSIQRFPTFPILVQRLVSTPIDPDQLSSVFTPEGLPQELAERTSAPSLAQGV